ncbi:MAG: hypothetical protein HYY86_00210 [Candidatus Harrisonbacteria bacterium]|nr:hypothetical protein [Candidatus Harrisonbacteria bacterium]
MHYAWFFWSLILLAVWVIVYFLTKEKESRSEMLKMSFWTSLLGLTEPLFVPEYWNPPTLFDLAQRTGFDLESFIFSFAIGGIATAIYELIFPLRHEKMSVEEMNGKQHRFHWLAVVLPPFLFVFLIFANVMNPIYSAIFSLIFGFFAAWYCRPDLKGKMAASGLIFLGIYFIYFQILILLYPGYVEAVWNFSNISGKLIFGIPLEELLFAFFFGLYWASVYEHLNWYKINWKFSNNFVTL